MPATLRALIGDDRFDLRPVSDVDDAVLAHPLLWAHSSDLPDPTPWIGADGLLLTDGVQFGGLEPAPAGPYVQRLVEHGVIALGFATGIVHDRIPAELADAAALHGLPLFEVPRRTPFMGIIRFVSDAVADDDRQMLETSLRAQRSVARAALRPDGLSEILRELERNLECWVALFDASGTRVRVPTRHEIPDALAPEVDAAVARMLARGRTAAERISLAAAASESVGEVTLQTLGQQNDLRGILAVGTGTGALDRARADLVEAVIALASIALEQSRTLDDARRRLRSGVLELLIAGVTGVAQRTVEHLWGPLPADPIRIGFIAPPDDDEGGAHSLHSALELVAGERQGALFFAEHAHRIVTVTPADDRDDLLGLLSRHRALAGFSAATTWEHFTEAMSEAQTTLARSAPAQPVNDFDELAHAGLLGHLERTRAHDIARRMLLPLHEASAPVDLRRTLEVWLEHNGAWDPAAKALGIHRHTLRARVDAASSLLDLNLDTFAARAEVWSALQLTRT